MCQSTVRVENLHFYHQSLTDIFIMSNFVLSTFVITLAIFMAQVPCNQGSASEVSTKKDSATTKPPSIPPIKGQPPPNNEEYVVTVKTDIDSFLSFEICNNHTSACCEFGPLGLLKYLVFEDLSDTYSTIKIEEPFLHCMDFRVTMTLKGRSSYKGQYVKLSLMGKLVSYKCPIYQWLWYHEPKSLPCPKISA